METKNFNKIACELNENGQTVLTQTLAPRSLVLVKTTKSGVTAYNVTAKCRNYDALSVCKSLAKAVLAAKRLEYVKNCDEDAQISKRRVYNPINEAMGAQYVVVTDSKGHIIRESELAVCGVDSLRKQFSFTKSTPLYKLVVLEGREWSDPEVAAQLNHWCAATIKQWNFREELEIVLGVAADSTEAEDDAAEAAAKKAAKAAKKAEKEAAKESEQEATEAAA